MPEHQPGWPTTTTGTTQRRSRLHDPGAPQRAPDVPRENLEAAFLELAAFVSQCRAGLPNTTGAARVAILRAATDAHNRAFQALRGPDES